MPETASIDLRDYIRNIPDFPKPGVMFKDITPLLADRKAFNADVERVVLSRAVLWHCQDRIIRYGNQTVVF